MSRPVITDNAARRRAKPAVSVLIPFLRDDPSELLQLLDEEDPFIFLASAGLATQFGAQAMINMAVNLNLLPSKGMTLPFISHGGSSFLALSMGMGLLLALTRRNRFLQASPYAKRWAAA